MFDPGEPVVLPDGRVVYFQRREADGTVVVLAYIAVPPAEAKKIKRLPGAKQ